MEKKEENKIYFKRVLLIEKLTKRDKDVILFDKINNILTNTIVSMFNGIPRKFLEN
jgi:hypothetical protein